MNDNSINGDDANSGFVMGGKSTGVEPGVYLGDFQGYEPCETQKGPAYKWRWVIAGPKNVGEIASCLTDRIKPRPTNGLGRTLNGLALKTLGEGERFDPKSVIGKRYTIVVTAGPTGGTRVSQILPPQ